MKRRAFMAFAAGAALLPPLVTRAQQKGAKVARVGFLYGGASQSLSLRTDAFLDGVGKAGRQQVELITRVAEGEPGRLPALASDLIAQQIDVLFAVGPVAVRAAWSAKPNSPIVALDLESDPVESGLIASLSRPGGNLTGVFLDFPDFSAKWLQLLREIMPVSRLAVLWDPSTGSLQLNAVKNVASGVMSLKIIEVKDANGLAPAFRAARDADAQAALFLSSPLFGSQTAPTAELALASQMPAIMMFPDFVRAGGLIAYGPNISDLFRQSGKVVAKVLGGAAPAELPVERPDRFELVINLKTAKALGLTIPPTLLARADEVVE